MKRSPWLIFDIGLELGAVSLSGSCKECYRRPLFELRQSELVSEFDRYVFEHPEWAEQLPREVVVIDNLMAVAVVKKLGIQPPKEGAYGHSWVQAVIAQEVIRRRKVIPRKFASYLSLILEVRQEADYKEIEVSKKRTERVLSMATEFMEALKGVGRS